MDRQACTRDTVLVKSREMTGRSQTLPWWMGGGGGRGKDDRKQNTLAPLALYIVQYDVGGLNDSRAYTREHLGTALQEPVMCKFQVRFFMRGADFISISKSSHKLSSIF
jgi:hypothetical protein